MDYDPIYPLASDVVDGREVLEKVPNTSSISASLYNYKILNGIREVSMEYFGGPLTVFVDQRDFERCSRLSEEIKDNNKISPLIIVVDKDGPYILEGVHRYVALYYLQAKSFPAMVVIDLDND